MRVNFSDNSRNFTINYNILITVVIILALGVSIGVSYFILLQKHRRVAQKNLLISRKYKEKIKQKQKYLKLEQKLEKWKNEIKNATPNFSFNNILKEMGYVIPSLVELKKIYCKKNIIIIKGRSLQQDHLILFLEKLNHSKLFSRCRISKINKKNDKRILFNIEGNIE